MLLPSALGFSPHPPVSVYGTGTLPAIAAFLGAPSPLFATFVRCASHIRSPGGVFLSGSPVFAPGSPFPARGLGTRPHSSVTGQYRNFHLLSIGYALQPRLRPRLTQGRSALPWNPWIFGHEDSHFILATHSGILSSCPSTAPSGTASAWHECSSTDRLHDPQASVWCFSPGSFSAQDLSASELLRTLLMCGCF